MRFIPIVTVLLLTACSGSDEQPEQRVADTFQQPPARHYDFYERTGTLPSYADVLALPYQSSDQVLRYGNDGLQTVEYWRAEPISGRETLPAILLVHGGCWSNSFRVDQSYPMATALALNGFHVWSVEYRASGDVGGGWPGTFEDVQQAVTAVLDDASQFYSPRALVLIGHSAGGHLAMLARSKSAEVFDVVGLAAIVDLIDYAEQSGSCNALARSFMDGSPSTVPERYAQANPDVSLLSDSAYLFVGGRDSIVRESQAGNSGLEYQVDEDAGHFDWIHPGTESFDELLFFLLNNAR